MSKQYTEGEIIHFLSCKENCDTCEQFEYCDENFEGFCGSILKMIKNYKTKIKQLENKS